MRTLLLFRGAPGCGKSTYIKKHGLEQYTLSADTIRMQCSSPVQLVNGSIGINQRNDKLVWTMLFQMLECRMQAGCFTVIDATNSKTAEMNRYKTLAKQYRYRVYIVDMTDLPIEECKRRNTQREPFKRVPEDAIDKIYARFATQNIPSGIKVLTPDNAMNEIAFRKMDASQYKTVHVIGDIHGCNSCLQEYLTKEGGMQDDSLYVFCGDYVDRGLENVEVIKFLLSIMDKPNVILLEGNHERWLYKWSHDQKTNSNEFEMHTKPQLDESDLDKKDVSRLYQRLNQCFWFSYHGNDFFVCHGGITPFKPEDLVKIPTVQMVRGVGGYDELPKLLDTWQCADMIQIFGHRNVQDYPIHPKDSNCVMLEGGVELGGSLRAVRIDKDGMVGIETPNHIYRKQENQEPPLMKSSISDLVNSLRHNEHIKESRYGNISAFNFTRDAFRKDIWNDKTTLARGLFIDAEREKIAARGYEKFFRIDELAKVYRNADGSIPAGNIDYLKHRFKFPVTAYLKENGYLGLVSYDQDADDLRFCTKGSIGSASADNFRAMFETLYFKKDTPQWNELKNDLRDASATLLFEVIDPVFDPHIIEYDHTQLVLLDRVYNTISFSKTGYSELVNYAERFGFTVKRRVAEFASWPEFFEFYTQAIAPGYQYNGSCIEGFVFEDSAGFMTKLKTNYYSMWKHMRSVADNVRRYGYYMSTASLATKDENLFYGFLRDKYETDEKFRDYKHYSYDIISLRNEFYHKNGGTEEWMDGR